MTAPTARARNVMQTGPFLKDLRADESLPEAIRVEAHRSLRHYPTGIDLVMLSKVASSVSSFTALNPIVDPAWLEGYRLGAHRP